MLMSDEELKVFFPKLGDRLSIKDFCKKSISSKKTSLIEKLKEKMNEKSRTEENDSLDRPRKSLKNTRVIEIGWMCTSKGDNVFRQVKTKAGGGTRKVNIPKNVLCTEVLEKAKHLFFPNGVSTKGHLDDFEVRLLDYKSHECDLDLTIQQMYELSALTVLRFYMGTIHKKEPLHDDEETFIPQTVTRLPSSPENNIEPVQASPTEHLRRSERLNQTPTTRYCQDFEGEPINIYSSSSLRRSERLHPPREITNYFENFSEDSIFNLDLVGGVELPEVNAIYSPPRDTTVEVDHQTSNFEKLILHRGNNIFKELVEAVQQREIYFRSVQIEMILPNGKLEQAKDIGGVLRDCISEFFRDFYETCTMGADYKVTALRHDFQSGEWSAIGKIIRESFLSERYFPIKLAPAFVKNCMGQEVEDSEMLQNFMKYVSASDATLLKNALDDFEKVDAEEIKEFCCNYEAKWIPSRNNFGKLIIQIAREELIQKPAFVKECINPHLVSLKDQLQLEVIYSKYETTDKNIIALLDIDEKITIEQKQIFSYSKRYIKESDQKIKSAFLRFCTGSELPIQRIKIEFTVSEGFGRIPIAHTCTGLLQIPTAYENFMIFRSELNNLFSSDIWIMDIV